MLSLAVAAPEAHLRSQLRPRHCDVLARHLSSRREAWKSDVGLHVGLLILLWRIQTAKTFLPLEVLLGFWHVQPPDKHLGKPVSRVPSWQRFHPCPVHAEVKSHCLEPLCPGSEKFLHRGIFLLRDPSGGSEVVPRPFLAQPAWEPGYVPSQR